MALLTCDSRMGRKVKSFHSPAMASMVSPLACPPTGTAELTEPMSNFLEGTVGETGSWKIMAGGDIVGKGQV